MVALVQAGSYSVDHFAKFDHDEVVAPILLYKDMTAHVASFNPGIALNMLWPFRIQKLMASYAHPCGDNYFCLL